ncbi:PBP1A family penicillin-binding protein [Aquisalibacillus elongatus]|uniref:Penicillin-binding protein 1A n=1 Tax=Aquisalibacillus elongatus TaxID=485577 RepID=A0A3N5BG79_9BACI|nr:PBP1A family penicillin-binding protein [Aquisalibacillus elongatus]RPF55799.1 penicillin-binding protein 1A [Aquisalibacillus elongatus]
MSQNVNSRKAKKQAKKKNKKINWKKIFIVLGIIGLIGMFMIGGVVFSMVKDAPPLDAEELQVPLSTTILDRDGEVVTELGAQKRELIEYDEVPQVLEDAILATEDARFYEHSGIDLRRIGGAVLANIKDGFGAQGASTITQQVVKNAFLTSEKSIERKVQEQYLAFQLEQEYEKEEILAMYLNIIAFGKDIYGVQKASEAFYGKENLDDLTLPEAALLAGIPQRPNAYNPYIDPELAEQRRNIVLNAMVNQGKITDEEANQAKEVKVTEMIQDSYESTLPYEAFIEQVLKETEEHLDDEVDVLSAGLTIHTTLDRDAQEHLEYLLSDESPISFTDEELQTGVSVLDTQTGAVLALGDSRNREGLWSGYNYAILKNGRQPGSTIKPIFDYGPAIEYEQWSTYHQLEDEEITYGNDNTKLTNFDDQYRGWMSMREALYQSINVPAFKTMDEVRSNNSEDAIKDFVKGLGLDIETLYDSDAIGGHNQYNTLEMAGAYAAFGNGGIYNEPHAVTKIEYPEKQEVIEIEPESNIAMEDYTAYMITDVLKDVIRQPDGSASNMNVGNLPVAGKTGTTDDVKDSWFVGYTTNYTISTWTGYPSPAELSWENRQIPKQVFSNMILKMSEGVETSDFEMPSSVVEEEIEEGTWPAKLPSDYTPENEIITELFVDGTQPSEVSEEYDQLDPVTNLSAEYDEDNNVIDVSWSHPNQDEGIAYQIRVSVDGSDMQPVGTVEETQITFDQITPGSEYTFEVTAVDPDDSDNQSEPAETSVETPDEDSDFWDEFFGDDEEEQNEEDENEDGSGGDDEGNPDEGGNDEGSNGDNEDEDEEESGDEEEDDNTGDEEVVDPDPIEEDE